VIHHSSSPLLSSHLLPSPLFSPNNCVETVHCHWGSYGKWSECDGCTKTQVRNQTNHQTCSSRILPALSSIPFLCILTNSLVLEDDKHTPNIMQSPPFLKIWRVVLSDKNHLLVVKNDVELAQFQNNVLATFPTVYDYASYRTVVKRFETHYLSEGTLGELFHALLSIDQETEKQMGETTQATPAETGSAPAETELGKTLAILLVPCCVWCACFQMRPLYELVREVQCAGVNRLHLKTAIEQYLDERHPCFCQPCRNNSLVVIEGDECKYICKPGVIHGSWSCWSGWTYCSGSQRLRTRTCSTHAPQRGCHHCNGTMEPQCFALTLTPRETFGSTPPLPNGYVVVRMDGQRATILLPGCHLIGIRISEYTGDQTWSTAPKQFNSKLCHVPSLQNDVTGSHCEPTYDIGEMIPLSYPEGTHIVGHTEILWSFFLLSFMNPAPKMLNLLDGPAVQCKPWEKLAENEFICKMAYDCTERVRDTRPAVCYNLTEDSACQWTFSLSYFPCLLLTGQTNRCRCEDRVECSDPGLSLFVLLGAEADSATQTLSECEAGLRRCKGEKVSVGSILPCGA
uniref:Complement component 7a n=1 Tax=Salmo trutta TaxID=8032 RepID=A0A673Z347_SALTR